MIPAIAVAYAFLVGGVIATGQRPTVATVVILLGVLAFGALAVACRRQLLAAWGRDDRIAEDVTDEGGFGNGPPGGDRG